MEKNIKQIILYGHKLHSHTHSYIHYGFKKGFEFMGYKTLWIDKNDDISKIDFSNSLFITEGQVDEKIPIRDDCYYALHNCDGDKYKSLKLDKKFSIQVYTHDVLKHRAKEIPNSKYCFYLENCLFMPWATDLLPHEIDDNIELVKSDKINSSKIVYFIGMNHDKWNMIKNICRINNIKYQEFGGFSGNNISSNENMKMIQKSLIAPSAQTDWQIENGYIPCRIFKNISYGKMGLTNNETVYNLFEKKIIYNSNITKLFKMGIEFENSSNDYKKKCIIPLMEDVKENHTYLNRIKLIFWMFNNILSK